MAPELAPPSTLRKQTRRPAPHPSPRKRSKATGAQENLVSNDPNRNNWFQRHKSEDGPPREDPKAEPRPVLNVRAANEGRKKKRKFEEVQPACSQDEPINSKKPRLAISLVDDRLGATLVDAVHTVLFTPQVALKNGDIHVAVPQGRFIEFIMILREHERQCERYRAAPDGQARQRAVSI